MTHAQRNTIAGNETITVSALCQPINHLMLHAGDAEGFRNRIVEALEQARDLDPAVVYAFKKTGYLFTEQLRENAPQSERRKYDEAIAEWRGKQEEKAASG